MKTLLLTLFSLGVAHGHLLEGVSDSLTVTYKSGHSVTFATKDDKLVKVEVTLNGEPIEVPIEDLASISHPDLLSVRIFETDLDKIKKYRLELRYRMTPDVHGSIDDDSAHEVVRFYFSEGRYGGRAIEFIPAQRRIIQGVAPQSATRSESDSKGGDKPQPESETRSR